MVYAALTKGAVLQFRVQKPEAVISRFNREAISLQKQDSARSIAGGCVV